MSNQEVIQNLKDAGCRDEIIDLCCQSLKNKDLLTMYQILQKHRQTLLNNLHIYQKKLDCLDYLLFQIEKSGEL